MRGSCWGGGGGGERWGWGGGRARDDRRGRGRGCGGGRRRVRRCGFAGEVGRTPTSGGQRRNAGLLLGAGGERRELGVERLALGGDRRERLPLTSPLRLEL